jgi:hypothetical protein
MRGQLWLAFGVAIMLAMAAPVLRGQDQDADNGQPNADEYTIPEGTEFKLQLHSTINSKTSKPGDRVMSTLMDPVSVEDTDVLPKGLRVDGHIGETKAAGRRGKGGYLSIVFDTIELPNGEKLAILGSLTEVFSSAGGGNPIVGPEGDLKGRGPSLKKRAAIAAVPVGVGAGAAAGGSPAAGIAAAAGGVVAAMLIPRGEQASLAAGSLIGMRLDRDVTLNPAQAANAPAGSNQPGSNQPGANQTGNIQGGSNQTGGGQAAAPPQTGNQPKQ